MTYKVYFSRSHHLFFPYFSSFLFRFLFSKPVAVFLIFC
nr:MAG TPA: hypothetical protein [Caudoviricetes sp.]